MDDKKKFGRKGKVYVSSVIEGPIEAVWGRTARFADGSWMPGVSASGYLEEGVPKEDNSVGKNRFLSFGDLQVVETLTGYSSTEHFYSYALVKKDEGLFPGDFINYHARMSFKRVTDKNATFAEWSAEFDGEESTVEAVEQFVARQVFGGSFNNLKLTFNSAVH